MRRRDEQAQFALEQYFKTLGERYLAPNQNLKVEVLDVDLAGRIDYGSRRFYDKRVMRGTADWPRMKFHYVLETDGKIVSDSQADIADILAAIPDRETFAVLDGYHAFMALPVDLRAVADRAFYIGGGYKYALIVEDATVVKQ